MARKSMVYQQIWCLICEFSLAVRLLLNRLSNSDVNIMSKWLLKSSSET